MLKVLQKSGRLALLLVSLLLTVLLLSACGSENSKANSGPAPVNSASATTAPTVQVASTALAVPTPSAPANTPGTPTPVPPTPALELPNASLAPAAPTPTPAKSDAKQPVQPATGPGGSEYAFKTVGSNSYGSGSQSYYIYEPSNPKPDKPLPLVVLLHGYEGVNPNGGYRLWIEHIVKRGNIVVFPVYQQPSSREGDKFTPDALVALQDALKRLQDGTHAKPDLDKFAIVGYSAGGVIATNLAAGYSKYQLPQPKALFAVTPGGCANCSILSIRNFTLASPAELGQIPPSIKMLLLAGDSDMVVGETATKLIWQSISQVPASNKNYLLAVSDNYGQPPLVADHGMTVHRPPNALDYNGIWKLFDGLESCALAGKDCDYALGNTEHQRSLGNWSDGRPVNELKVLG
ncbi:MAG TPA: alpha/beta hydrolase fold domain-containing protein [Chloroflexia bacterium]|nr:alpha/beta hydrolase fold domain-containing protein [Chloroflexia bacterium]